MTEPTPVTYRATMDPAGRFWRLRFRALCVFTALRHADLSEAANLVARTFGINYSTRRIGGMRFVKLDRLTVSFCVSREYRPL